MSCHEKLLEKKRLLEHEKKMKNNRMSRIPEKSLPKVPPERTPQSQLSNVTSPTLTASPGDISQVDTIGTNQAIPPRSPSRPIDRLSSHPQSSSSNKGLLEAPVSLSPIKIPDHLSPDIEISDPYDAFFKKSGSNRVSSAEMAILNTTPRRERASSPLRRNVQTPNRQAAVIDELSSSSSNNILSSYIGKDSPPPKIPIPRVPDDDFIDMDDSDEDISKYLEKPTGLGGIRHSDSIPTGLNIQGLPSFDDDFNKPTPKINKSESPRPSFDEKRPDEITLENHAQVSKSSITSPVQKKSALSNITNDSALSKSLSLRSPKKFLGFRKHKKSTSQSSVENYKISSPIIDSKNHGPFDENSEHQVLTPRSNQNPASPYQGAALFTTPPVPAADRRGSSTQRKLSVHSRSRSDANGVEQFGVSQAELELRSLRTEIRDLKTTKSTILREVADLSSQRDVLNIEVVQLQGKIAEMKLQYNENSSKSSLDVTDRPPSSTSSFQQQQQQPSSSTAGSTPVPDDIHVAEQVDSKQAKSKPKFWKRGNFFGRNESMASSPSVHSINALLNDDKSKNGHPQISPPIVRSDETDELGGNDNKKLLSTKGFSLGANPQIVKSGTQGLIMSDLFNSSLEMRAEYEQRSIPLVVTRLINEVEKRGLDSEGIYRKNGAASQTNAILKAFNNLYQSETSQELESALNVGDVNAISSSLKRYLYFHLPEPVITMQAYESFIGVNKLSSEDKVVALAQMISSLPPTNGRALVAMLIHLKRVESHSNLNKMTFHNLSVVFAPTFARVSDGERELMDMAQRNNVTEFLLVHQDEILKLANV
jgi:hypothetical protein